MTELSWDDAIRAGIVTEGQALSFAGRVLVDELYGGVLLDVADLDDAERFAFERAVIWFVADGRIH